MTNMLDRIRQRVSKSGGKKEKLFYIKGGNKKRIRFLADMDEATAIVMHDKWGELNTICLKHLGKPCPYDKREDVRTRDNFAWPIWSYDDAKVQIFLFKANDKTPVPALLGMYDIYGSLMDRDYVIVRTGEQLDTSYSVVPLDKAKFGVQITEDVPDSNDIIELVAAAFAEDADEEDEPQSARPKEPEAEAKPKHKKSAQVKAPAPDPEPAEEAEEPDEDADLAEMFDETDEGYKLRPESLN